MEIRENDNDSQTVTEPESATFGNNNYSEPNGPPSEVRRSIVNMSSVVESLSSSMDAYKLGTMITGK